MNDLKQNKWKISKKNYRDSEIVCDILEIIDCKINMNKTKNTVKKCYRGPIEDILPFK